MFDRKLKIVEIFSADVVGSSLSPSYDVFLFFPLSPSVNLLILFPRDAVFISTNCSKRRREEYFSKIYLKARRRLFNKNEKHSLLLSILQDSISTNE